MSSKYSYTEFSRDYNQIYCTILREERKKRMLSQEELASGILSRAALGNMEAGKMGWRKLVGDTLLQRMGVPPEYFEMVASSDELDRWRLREDICLLVPDRPQEAGIKIAKYRQKYSRREPLEEQFLRKVELILRLAKIEREVQERAFAGNHPDGDRLLAMAEDAVSCTVTGDWKGNLGRLWLAPSELEAILLVGAASAVCGRMEEAGKLWREVWNYPEAHQWKGRMAVMILPQVALLGMWLALCEKDYGQAFVLGREAVELLRRNSCHCYLLQLLEMMARIPEQAMREEEREYLGQMEIFRDAFGRIYSRFGCPGHRIWQGISVENTREAGLVLKMLRKFTGKSRAKAVYDGEEMVVTERQLEKIEKGVHKPSYENYQRLARQYGKGGGWRAAMLETDSAEVLELRQQIATLVGRCEWEKVEREMEQLRGKVDINFPRVKQEFLFLEALLVQEKTGDLRKSLDMLLEALYITVPDMEGKDRKWWVFQREEIIIAVNIASSYQELGEMEKAGKWYGMLCFSLNQQRGRTGIGLIGYSIWRDSYDNYLGELKQFEEAVKISEEAVCDHLKQPQFGPLARAYYRIAWNLYEIASENPLENELLRGQWKNSFQISEAIAYFSYNGYLQKFLKDRQRKYLF